jgi:hypothetical protein
MLDERTKEYRKQNESPFSWQLPCSIKLPQENSSNNQGTTSKEKSSKFGNFMGKLLLKSSSNASKIKKSVPKQSLVETKGSTELPLTGYFRFMKRRTHQSDTKEYNGFPKINFKFSTAREHGNENTHIVGLNTQTNTKPKYRLLNGRRTRWDVIDPVASSNDYNDSSSDVADKLVDLPQDPASTENADMCERGIDFDFQFEPEPNDDIMDDGSSLGSLQSDDDVLGPWIELGMLDSVEGDTKKSSNISLNHNAEKYQAHDLSEAQCKDCKLLTGHNQKPLDISNLCLLCQNKWSDTLSHVFRKFEITVLTQAYTEPKENPKSKKVKMAIDNTKKKANAKKKVDALDKEKTSNQTEKINGERLLPHKLKKSLPVGIPPTKSTHTKKTNKKMATASSKNQNIPKKTTVTARPITVMPETNNNDDHNCIFAPNPRGLVHKQIVEVLNINGHWYRGTLELMDKSKVKVKYIDWDDQEEWVIIGSKRLRTIQSEDKESSQITDQQTESTEGNCVHDFTHFHMFIKHTHI